MRSNRLLLLATHRLAAALAGAGIGLGALATYRQAALVAQTAVAANRLHTLEVTGYFAAQVTLNEVTVLLDGLDELIQFFLTQLMGAAVRIDAGFLAQEFSAGRADTVNVTKGVLNFLSAGNINTK